VVDRLHFAVNETPCHYVLHEDTVVDPMGVGYLGVHSESARKSRREETIPRLHGGVTSKVLESKMKADPCCNLSTLDCGPQHLTKSIVLPYV
jgi:hypothetical protein